MRNFVFGTLFCIALGASTAASADDSFCDMLAQVDPEEAEACPRARPETIEKAADTLPPQTSLASTLGFYAGERDNGGNKICLYNKLGRISTLTVPLVSACPR